MLPKFRPSQASLTYEKSAMLSFRSKKICLLPFPIQESYALKRLMHELLSITQTNLFNDKEVQTTRITTMQNLIETQILPFMDSLSSALKRHNSATQPTSSYSQLIARPLIQHETATQKETDQKKMRMQVLNELSKTETTYLTQLKALNLEACEPLLPIIPH